MENLRAQDEASHGVHKSADQEQVSLLLSQAVVAEVEELDSLTPFYYVHDLDDLLREEGVPRQA